MGRRLEVRTECEFFGKHRLVSQLASGNDPPDRERSITELVGLPALDFFQHKLLRANQPPIDATHVLRHPTIVTKHCINPFVQQSTSWLHQRRLAWH